MPLTDIYHLSNKIMIIQTLLCSLNAYLVPAIVLGALQVQPLLALTELCVEVSIITPLIQRQKGYERCQVEELSWEPSVLVL